MQSFITSSANLEDRQYRQYNSFLKIDDPGLYAFGLDYFARLEAQSLRVDGARWDDRRKAWSSGAVTAAVYPNRSDLLLSTLRDLSCTRGARDVSAMFAVIQRADVRAQLARLSDAGCRVRVITSRDTVENWLRGPAARAATCRTPLGPHRADPRQDARRARAVPRPGDPPRAHRHVQHHLRRPALQRRGDAAHRRQPLAPRAVPRALRRRVRPRAPEPVAGHARDEALPEREAGLSRPPG